MRFHWWHRPDPTCARLLGGTFIHDTCRTCALTRITWLHRGQPWWRSTWTTPPDADKQLRRFAADAILPQ